MRTLVLPRRVTIEESYALLAVLAELDREGGRCEIDASRCERFGPIGSALIGIAIARRVASNRGAPAFLWPSNREVRRHLEELGFERFLRGRGADHEAAPQLGTLECRPLTALDPRYVQQLADLLAEH